MVFSIFGEFFPDVREGVVEWRGGDPDHVGVPEVTLKIK
jgi:hypothetical protein